MDNKEFDDTYKDRGIREEASLLQYFRDIKFYTIQDNLAHSSHKKADLNGVISGLGRFADEHPDVKTFGDLKESDPAKYKNCKTDIMRFIEKFHYQP